jgi:hypothetical protein
MTTTAMLLDCYFARVWHFRTIHAPAPRDPGVSTEAPFAPDKLAMPVQNCGWLE